MVSFVTPSNIAHTEETGQYDETVAGIGQRNPDLTLAECHYLRLHILYLGKLIDCDIPGDRIEFNFWARMMQNAAEALDAERQKNLFDW